MYNGERAVWVTFFSSNSSNAFLKEVRRTHPTLANALIFDSNRWKDIAILQLNFSDKGYISFILIAVMERCV
jgi:hypothetical protein